MQLHRKRHVYINISQCGHFCSQVFQSVSTKLAIMKYNRYKMTILYHTFYIYTKNAKTDNRQRDIISVHSTIIRPDDSAVHRNIVSFSFIFCGIFGVYMKINIDNRMVILYLLYFIMTLSRAILTLKTCHIGPGHWVVSVQLRQC